MGQTRLQSQQADASASLAEIIKEDREPQDGLPPANAQCCDDNADKMYTGGYQDSSLLLCMRCAQTLLFIGVYDVA